MKIKFLFASFAIAISGAAIAATDLGVLDASGQDFSKTFWRIFAAGSPIGAFTDHYTFSLASPAGAVGTAFAWEFGFVDLALTSVVLSDGNGFIQSDSTPASFAFSSLDAGKYYLDISGTFTGILGKAGYSGTIHSVASAAPEPEALAMALAGMMAVGLLARRREQG